MARSLLSCAARRWRAALDVQDAYSAAELQGVRCSMRLASSASSARSTSSSAGISIGPSTGSDLGCGGGVLLAAGFGSSRSSGTAAGGGGRVQSCVARSSAGTGRTSTCHLAAGLNHIRDLTELPRPDRSLGAGAGQKDFATRHTQLHGVQEVEALANDADQAVGQLPADVALYLRGKRHADAAQGFSAIGRMHSGENQVPCFRGVQGEPHHLGVRISLITSTSGFSRKASTIACSKLGEWVGISRCRMKERRLEKTYSSGLSSVMMLSGA